MPKFETVLAPDFGLMDKRLDTQLVNSKVSPSMKNIRKWGNFIAQRPGRISYGSLDGFPVGYFHFNVGTINRFLAFTSTKVYHRDTSGWSDITGTALTGTQFDYMDATMAYDGGAGSWYVVLTNGVDDIRTYNGSGNTANLANWTGTHKAKFVRYFKGYLLAAYVTTSGTEYPFRIICSDTDAPDTLTGNSRTFNLTQDINMSNIMRMELLDDYVIVYKTDAIYIGYLVSDPDQIFSFDLLASGVGLRAFRAVANTPWGHYFLGFDNVYYLANTGTKPTPIATSQVRYEIFESESAGLLERVNAVYDQEDNHVRFYMPSGNVFVYDIEGKSWWKEYLEDVNAAYSYHREISNTWADLNYAWNSASASTLHWNDRGISDNFPILIEGKVDGSQQYGDNMTFEDNTNQIVESYFDTADRIYERSEDEIPFNYKRILGIRFEAKGSGVDGQTDQIEVYYSTDEGENWTQITKGLYSDNTTVWTNSCPLDGEYKWYEAHIDVDTKKIRFRFKNSSITSTFYLRKWIEIFEEMAWEG